MRFGSNDFDQFHPTDIEMTLLENLGVIAKKDDLFVIKRIACDNLLDRQFDILEPKFLESVAKSCPNTPALLNHRHSVDSIWGKNFYGEVKVDNNKRGQLGTPNCGNYKYTEVRQFTYRLPENKSILQKIALGLDDKVSIGFGMNVEDIVCSICGNPIWEFDLEQGRFLCPHMPGRQYENSLCYKKLMDLSDFYELSNVAVPAQREAGTIKTIGSITNKDILSSKEDDLIDIVSSIGNYVDYRLFKYGGQEQAAYLLKYKLMEDRMKIFGVNKGQKPEDDKIKEEKSLQEEEATTEETEEKSLQEEEVAKESQEESETKEETQPYDELKDFVKSEMDSIDKKLDSVLEVFENAEDVDIVKTDDFKEFTDKVDKGLADIIKDINTISESIKKLDADFDSMKNAVSNKKSVDKLTNGYKDTKKEELSKLNLD